MPAAQFTDQQEVPVSVRFLDDHGRVVPVERAPSWEEAAIDPGGEALVDLVVEPDGMSAVIRSRGVAGNTTVEVAANVQIDGGIRGVVGILDVTVTPSGAVTVEFTVGEPRPIAA